MKVLHISSSWPPRALGGAEIYASQLAAAQEQAGHDVGLVTFGAEHAQAVRCVPPWPYRLEEFADQPPWRKVAFRLVDVYNPRSARLIDQAIADFGPDVVHSHSVAGLSTAALTTAHRVGHAQVHHLHDYWLLCRRTSLTKASGEQCTTPCRSCAAISSVRSRMIERHPPDLLLAPSRDIAVRHSALAWTKGRIRLLPHPLPAPPRPRGRTMPPPGGPVTFGYLGQLARHKGVHTLLEAFAELAAEGHHLVLAGRGPLSAEVERAGEAVRFTGWLDETGKETFFEEIDCLVVPSQCPETGPLVALEARGRRVPVAGARIGAVPEQVEPNAEPLLFDPFSVEDLRRALRMFVSDPSRYTPGGTGRWGWPEHVEAVTELYEEARRAKRGR